MSGTPYPISGIIYDADSAVIASVSVSIINTDTNEELTATTNASGEYVVDLANLTSGYHNGDIISIYSSYGRYYSESFHTVSTTTGYGSANLTLSTQMSSSAVYCSTKDVRDFTNVGSGEYSNTQLYSMIKMATGMIDDETGRTWKGVQTTTEETYDGDDTDILDLDNVDIQSVTTVAVDDDDDGTYTTVTSDNSQTSSGCFVYGDEGYLVLDDDANITSFTSGMQTVKVTYTWGNSKPTEEIRYLCILMVSNMIKRNTVFENLIEKKIKELKRKFRVKGA